MNPKDEPETAGIQERASITKGEVHMYLPNEKGQGLVEYALILVLVAIVVIAILLLVGPQIANIFSKVTNGLSST